MANNRTGSNNEKPSDKKDGNFSEQRERSAVGYAMSLGFGIAIPLAFFIVGGFLLDGWLNTKPAFVLFGILLGLVASGYALWKLLDLGSTK